MRFDQASELSGRSRRTVLVGLLLTALSVWSLSALRVDAVERHLATHGESFAGEASRSIRSGLERTHSVAALFEASDGISADDFGAYVTGLDVGDGVAAVGYSSLDGAEERFHRYPRRVDVSMPSVDQLRRIAETLAVTDEVGMVAFDPSGPSVLVAEPVHTTDLQMVGVAYAIIDLSMLIAGAPAGLEYSVVAPAGRQDPSAPEERWEQVEVVGDADLRYVVESTAGRGPDYPLLLVAVFGVVGTLLAASRIALREEKIAAELALEELQRSTSDKDRFMASVSHELRTPLTSVVGLASVLETSWRSMDDDDVQRMISDIHHEGRELADLVEDLLTIGRVESEVLTYRPHDISLDDEVDRVVSRLFVSDRVRILRDEPLDLAFADPLRTRQIIRNLVANASRHAVGVIAIRPVLDSDGVGVEIGNDGPAIPPELAQRLFQPYQSGPRVGQPGSIGLGLYVSRRLARAMGGDLEHVPGSGMVVFRLTLPQARQTAEPVGAAAADQS